MWLGVWKNNIEIMISMCFRLTERFSKLFRTCIGVIFMAFVTGTPGEIIQINRVMQIYASFSGKKANNCNCAIIL